MLPRAEPHLVDDHVDEKDWVAQNAVAFFVAFGLSLALLIAFCIYALKRGPNRRLWPCLSRRRPSPASTSPTPAGPDYSVWAATGAPSDWGQKVYLTDLKRQSIAHQLSQPGIDQRVVDWQSHPQGQNRQRWSGQSHIPSPLGSDTCSPSQKRLSPASTFHSNTHILQPSRSPASTLSPSRPKRGSSLPSSPLAAAAATLTARERKHERDSFGHTPNMYAPSSSRGSVSQEIAVPPLAKVAYSPFAPRGSLLAPAGQRDSFRSDRGYAV